MNDTIDTLSSARENALRNYGLRLSEYISSFRSFYSRVRIDERVVMSACAAW